MTGQAGRTVPGGPYETRRQAAADVAEVYAQGRISVRRGVMGEANLARLKDTCEQAGINLGSYDSQILAWLAGWEPETCGVIAGLVSRAYAAGLARAVPMLDEDCLAGRHAWCPGGLCQCPECRHDLRRHL